MIRNRLVLVGALVIVVAGACVPAEELPEPLDKDHGPNTTMGAIQERGVLRVGLSEVEPLAGFTEDIATELASILDVSLELVPVTPEDVHVALAEGDIDVGFPLKPLTEEVVRRNAVTDPYFVSYQRVLAPAGSDAEDLEGLPVCITGEEPVTIEVGDATRGSISDCTDGLRTGRFKAASGLEFELHAIDEELGRAGFDPGLTIQGDALSTAGLSAFVQIGASDFIAFLEQAFDEFVGSGEWMDSFEATFGDLDGEASLPGLSAEEAAALFPR